jgi:chromosome segregation ATPase
MWGSAIVLVVLSASRTALAESSFLAVAKDAAKNGFGKNPISKVADMLESMATEIEEDKKAEQDLFDKFECWWKTVCTAKKASINEAEETISALTAYIDDIQSGRIEFSSEGADATKDVAELMTELEKAKALREKENEDFEAAKDEMETTIGALEKALEELEAGTEGSLLADKVALKHKVLAQGKVMYDASKVQLLEFAFGEGRGGLGSPDYKKLNKKREFNEKYSKASGKIQELIADMLQTFKDNLDEAKDKEKSAKETYETLRDAKENQLKSAKSALESLGGETASREEATQEAKDEITTLEEQITKDKEVIGEVTTTYEEKLGEWKERKKLMTLEIMSVSKALSILRSDDARDAMSTSFDKDKVYSFVQVSEANSVALQNSKKKSDAVTALRVAAKKLHKSRELWTLARKIEVLKEDGRFDGVIEILNNVKKDLMKESKDDKKKKEECDTTLTEKTEEAQTSANIIDEKTREINRTKFEVSELEVEVNKTVDEVAELEWELNDATIQRGEMNEAYAKEKVGLEAAIDFIGKAKDALKKYFDDHQSLVQVNRRQPDEYKVGVVEAGKDAPPPPPTVTKPYKGNPANKGIQGMLDDIRDDVKDDLKTLETNEKKSVKDYKKTKSDLESSIETKMTYKKETEEQIAGKLEDISAEKASQLGEQDTLDAVVETLKAAEPSCNYVFTTYDTRIDNRKIEADGIDDAIEALGGDKSEVEFKDAAKGGGK